MSYPLCADQGGHCEIAGSCTTEVDTETSCTDLGEECCIPLPSCASFDGTCTTTEDGCPEAEAEASCATTGDLCCTPYPACSLYGGTCQAPESTCGGMSIPDTTCLLTGDVCCAILPCADYGGECLNPASSACNGLVYGGTTCASGDICCVPLPQCASITGASCISAEEGTEGCSGQIYEAATCEAGMECCLAYENEFLSCQDVFKGTCQELGTSCPFGSTPSPSTTCTLDGTQCCIPPYCEAFYGGQCIASESCSGELLGSKGEYCYGGEGAPPYCCIPALPHTAILASLFGIFLGVIVLSILLSFCGVDRLLGVQELEAEAIAHAEGKEVISVDPTDWYPTPQAGPARESAKREEVAHRLQEGKLYYGIRHSALPRFLQANRLLDHVLPWLGYRPPFIVDLRAGLGDFLFFYQNNSLLCSMFLCPSVNPLNRMQRRLLFYCGEGVAFLLYVVNYMVLNVLLPSDSSPSLFQMVITGFNYGFVVPMKIVISLALVKLMLCRRGQGAEFGAFFSGSLCILVGTACFMGAVLILSVLDNSDWGVHPGMSVYTYAYQVLVTSFLLEAFLAVLRFWPVPLPEGWKGRLLGMIGLAAYSLEIREDARVRASLELQHWPSKAEDKPRGVDQVEATVNPLQDILENDAHIPFEYR